MMQVSAKTEYGLRILLQLAGLGDQSSLSLSEIIQKERLPRHYAVQILVRLRRAGLVKSIRGTQGGFALTRPPTDVSVGQVVRALEGSPFIDTCNHFNRRSDCGHLAGCGLRPV